MSGKILAKITLVLMVAASAIAGTRAFYADVENSTANKISAGNLDLKVDSRCFYTHNEAVMECVCDQSEPPLCTWQGGSLAGQACGCSWQSKDLGNELFFNLDDIKPYDLQQEAVSLYVEDNPSWICANVRLTKNDDESCTTEEKADDPDCDDPAIIDKYSVPGAPDANLWDGDLARHINYVFWADDGDNVLETGEKVLINGNAGRLPLGAGNPGATYAIADSEFNGFGETIAPMPGKTVKYVAKAFCFGTLTLAPVAPDTGAPGINPGFSCIGSGINNATQTDSMSGDITFWAVQARHQDGFTCRQLTEAPAYLTVDKIVSGGDKSPDDFWLTVDGMRVLRQAEYGFGAGTHQVGEMALPNYTSSFGGDCSATGTVELAPGAHKSCTITNVYNGL